MPWRLPLDGVPEVPGGVTVPSSAATPYGERVPRGADWPRPSPVAAGRYVRGRFGSGAGRLAELDEPEDDPPEGFDPDFGLDFDRDCVPD